MNRLDLEATAAEKTALNRKIVNEVVGAVLDTITDSLVKGEAVRLVNFGTFQVQDRPARRGKNPKTGEEITIEAARRVSFKPGKHLKSAVNAD
jgi:DNA-binding protein HU-beta